MAVSIISPKFYGWDADGNPLAFGKLYSYEARSNTPKPTYKSEDQVTENTNPVILNGEGYADVYLDGSYKIVLKDSEDNEIWTADPVSAASPSEWVNCRAASYVSSTSFSVGGDFTQDFQAGRSLRLDSNAVDFAYTTVVSASFSSGITTVTVKDEVVTTGLVSSCISVISPNSTLSVLESIKEVEDYAKSIEDSIPPAITESQEDLLPPGSKLFKGDDGIYVKDGDIVEPGTTHLRVLVGGKPTIVAILPQASGTVSSITDDSATIGGTLVTFEPLNQATLNLGKQPDLTYDLNYTESTGSNNSPNINAIIGQIITENSPLGFGKVALREGGQIGISNQIYINEKSVIISGNNSIIKWIGSAPTTESMVRIDDSSRCKLEGMVLSGNLDNPPFAAIRFYRSTAVDEVGTNENHVVEHVIIGRRFLKDTTTGGSADDTPNGRLQNGIVIDGIDGNNDEYVIKSTQIHNCDGDGITFANTQSIWSRIQDTLLNDNNVGVRAGCNLIMQNPTFNRNVTADVYGIRDVEVKIDGFNAENSEVFTLSESGASFFIDGGELQMNRSDRGDFFRTLNGGTLSVLNAFIDNIEGTEQRIVYYRAGSEKPTLVRFDCPYIRGGEDRDNWDIDSSNTDTCIDIKYRDFEFKTNKPYADRQITPPTVLDGEAGLVGSGFHSSPLGDLYNVAYLGDNDGQHITPAFEIATQIRARIYNVSGVNKTLGTSRFRWLNLTDKIARIVVKPFDLPAINSFKSTTFDVSVPGANFGDIISVGAKSSTLGLILSAYVKLPNVVTVVASNVSGGLANPSLIDFTIGVVKPFGNRFGGKEVATQNIASGVTVEIDVDCAGAKQGSHAFFTPPGDCLGLTMSCYALNDSVKILITNMTDAAIDTPDGSWAVMCAI